MENKINARTEPNVYPGGDGCINIQALKDLVGDDLQQVKEILQVSIEPLREMVREIQTAHEQHLFEGIRHGAHKLYSSARAIGAHVLADLCLDLELAGEDGDWAVIEQSATKLDSLMIDIEDYVSCF